MLSDTPEALYVTLLLQPVFTDQTAAASCHKQWVNRESRINNATLMHTLNSYLPFL